MDHEVVGGEVRLRTMRRYFAPVQRNGALPWFSGCIVCSSSRGGELSCHFYGSDIFMDNNNVAKFSFQN